MGNVVPLSRDEIINVPFGPRENTPELRTALRKASVKDVRGRLADHSRVSAKTWALIGKELMGEKKRAKEDGPKVFPSLFAVTASQRNNLALYPFSLRTADRLICIGEMNLDPLGPNIDRLPASWRTLYELSRISNPRLANLIESGAVHPMMTRAEASKLAGSKPAKRQSASPGYGVIKQHFLAIKTPDARAAAFLKLMRDCHITINQLQGAV